MRPIVPRRGDAAVQRLRWLVRLARKGSVGVLECCDNMRYFAAGQKALTVRIHSSAMS